MFDEIRVREAQENVHYSCFVSFMEIYNEKMTDLLDATSDKKLNILHPYYYFLTILMIIEFALEFLHSTSSRECYFPRPSCDC